MADNMEKEAEKKIREIDNNTKEFANILMKYMNQSENGTERQKKLFYCGTDAGTTNQIYEKYQDFLDNLQEQLEVCGVNEDYSIALSCYLYATFVNKIPVILAGVNGISIANAFSLAMTNRSPGILNLEDEFDSDLLDTCRKSDDKVILVNNPFNHSWVPYLPYFLKENDKFIFLNIPYTEDLKFISQEVLNMALPIFTTPIMVRKEEEKCCGGIWQSQAIHYEPKEQVSHFCKKISKKMSLSPLSKSIIDHVLTDFHELYTDQDASCMEWMFTLFPYAYIKDSLDKALELASNNDNNKKVVSCWQHLYGKEEEE